MRICGAARHPSRHEPDGRGRCRGESTWFGQPKGLTILFLTQMWEQFSYYGMRALLVYYMTRELLLGQEKASLIYGAYTATAYFTPIFGGMLADSWLGKRRAVILGAAIMAAGHFMMSFDALLYVALATIALGNGLFLPSLPSQINDLYEASDPRRARAYNIYYVGINIGGFLAPLDLRDTWRALWLARRIRCRGRGNVGRSGHLRAGGSVPTRPGGAVRPPIT